MAGDRPATATAFELPRRCRDGPSSLGIYTAIGRHQAPLCRPRQDEDVETIKLLIDNKYLIVVSANKIETATDRLLSASLRKVLRLSLLLAESQGQTILPLFAFYVPRQRERDRPKTDAIPVAERLTTSPP